MAASLLSWSVSGNVVNQDFKRRLCCLDLDVNETAGQCQTAGLEAGAVGTGLSWLTALENRELNLHL